MQLDFDLSLSGGGEYEERAEDLDSSQRVRDHLVVYHLAPAITEIISDEHQEYCDNELEQTLRLLHSEWSNHYHKEIEPSRQNSTHHPLVSNKLTRKVQSSCVETGRGKRSQCQRLHMTLREQDSETPLVIGKTWFLGQEIPTGGFVRIQDSSQVWEERVDETNYITTEGLTTCLDPGRGWTFTSGGWNFLEKQECWKGHEQELIKTTRKETKRTEQLEEAGYRVPTWAVLRGLQQIKSATRI